METACRGLKNAQLYKLESGKPSNIGQTHNGDCDVEKEVYKKCNRMPADPDSLSSLANGIGI